MARQRFRRAMACRVLPHDAVTTGFRIVAGVRQLSLSLVRHSSRIFLCKRLAVRVQSRRLLHNPPSTAATNPLAPRSEEIRVGKERVITCRYSRSQDHEKKNYN